MSSHKHLWFLLTLPALFFLVVIFLFIILSSIFYSTDEKVIELLITDNIPVVLLFVQILTFGLLAKLLHQEGQKIFDFGLIKFQNKTILREILMGLMLGVGLGFAYIYFISPLHVFLQTTFGDYVPPEQVGLSLGGNALIFFLANVLLTPFVEERLYRGYALSQLQKRFGKWCAIIISSLFFGLLHWMGGFWYMVITCVVIGVPFGLIATLRQSILLVFFAHLFLNLVEFFYFA